MKRVCDSNEKKMFSIERSTHPEEKDRFIRLTTDRGVFTLTMVEWAYALAHAGQCDPSGRPIGPQDGGTPMAPEAALLKMAA